MVSAIRKFALVGLFLAGSAFSAEPRIEPSGGLVPDAETAVAIAVAVFKPIFGAEKIESQRPFHAELNGEIWHVYGSLPVGWRGGTAEAELSRKDGRIIRVWHSR
jgi:hypothetical protein